MFVSAAKTAWTVIIPLPWFGNSLWKCQVSSSISPGDSFGYPWSHSLLERNKGLFHRAVSIVQISLFFIFVRLHTIHYFSTEKSFNLPGRSWIFDKLEDACPEISSLMYWQFCQSIVAKPLLCLRKHSVPGLKPARAAVQSTFNAGFNTAVAANFDHPFGDQDCWAELGN